MGHQLTDTPTVEETAQRDPAPPRPSTDAPLARHAAQPAAMSPDAVLALQRGAGNAAVSGLLARAPGPVLARFDAGSGGHQGIERDVAGVDPHGGLAHHLDVADPKAGTREAGTNAIYAGNFMQDFSQLKVPNFHKILEKVPKNPAAVASGGKSEGVGAAGAEAISDALIEALAILEVGPRLAKQTVAANPQSYRPEQHVDQPQGYSAATDTLVADTQSKDPSQRGHLRPGRAEVEGGGFGMAVCTVDPDRDRELKGSAVPGNQVENPELLKVSDAGLQNHIYNSAEWVKGHWMQAASLGPTDQGRFHLGAGLHAVEDYWAHSNFIEVALNGYIDRAMGQRRHGKKLSAGLNQFVLEVMGDEAGGPKGKPHVDTMFDAKNPSGKRQAVTTGSVGSNDLKASIGHILLPRIPDLQTAIDTGIDRIFHLVERDDDNGGSWATIKKTLGEDRPAAAIMALGEGLDKAGMTLPVPSGVELEWSDIDIPLLPDPSYPSGFHITYEDQPITGAIGSYAGFVKSVKSTIESVKEVLDYIKYLGPVAYFAVKAIKALLSELQDLIKKELAKLRDKIKHEIAMFVVQMLDEISGVDVVDEKNRTIGDALHDAEDRVEEFEQRTSLEARLLDPGDLGGLSKGEVESRVGPVEAAPGGGWKALGPLAPSHSEIAKDHAPAAEDLDMHDPDSAIRDIVGGAVHDIGDEDPAPLDPSKKAGDDDEHDHAHGSVFYGLARALAVEADRHVMRQAEIMWAGRGSLYGDGQALDASAMQVGHDAFAGEAGKRAQAEQARSQKAGHRHAQSEAANAKLLAERPGARELLDMVDLIMSHPEDSQWWRPIFDRYIDANPEEVADHIRRRNKTRGARTRVPA